MAPKPRFESGETVLCYYRPLMYEAKCLRSQTSKHQIKYFIHYIGWNKKWDEWVPEHRVFKCNEMNVQRQKYLAKMHLKNKMTKSAAKTPVTTNTYIKTEVTMPGVITFTRITTAVATAGPSKKKK